MILSVTSERGQYPVVIESGCLGRAGDFFNLDRKCLILTDENIPKEYIEKIVFACKDPFVFVIPSGEDSKSLDTLSNIVSFMLEKGFDRKSCLISCGGGVVGDLGGFVASVFMRGIDFYNIPTTTLSQVDSSIGGKVAVNFKGLKNMVGAFYPPKGVLIDPETLKSLPRRQISNGLCEAVKMALCFDSELFSLFEREDAGEHLEEIMIKSLEIKKRVVEEDEKEAGLRKVLNFGHTLGHAVEKKSIFSGKGLFHGECVALGMIPMCSDTVRERLIPVLERIGLPTKMPYEPEEVFSALSHDKKMAGDQITVVFVEEVGSYRLEKMPFDQFISLLKERMR